MNKFLIFLTLLLPLSAQELMNQTEEGKRLRLEQNQSLSRTELQEKLCHFMLLRYTQPIEDWIVSGKVKGVMKTSPDDEDYYIKDDKEYWFVLIIEGDKVKGYPIWIKFYLSWADMVQKYSNYPEYGDNYVIHVNNYMDYVKEKRNSLIFQLEQSFIENMHDMESHEAIIHGTPHLYRLITKNTNINKLKKEDLIY